jgi:hypothetical protein
MRRNSMLGEDMDNEKFGQLGGGDSIVSQNEESLFTETVYHYQNSGKPSESGSCLIKSMKIDSQEWSGIGS